jgi:hypothetical protein
LLSCYSSERVLWFCLELALDCNLSTYPSQKLLWVAWTTTVWDGFLLVFCLVWPQATIFPISTSQVSEITGTNHCSEHKFLHLIFKSLMAIWPFSKYQFCLSSF